MFRKPFKILLLLSLLVFDISAQDTPVRKFFLNGYVSFMESAMEINMPGDEWLWESLLHNRLNFDYYPSGKLSFSLQARNRLIAGGLLEKDVTGAYHNTLEGDAGIADLSWNLFSGGKYVFNSSIDRLWMKYSLDKLEITAGRQRINWGQTYVWNPNDWFNNYSFFDVDYIERPGSDALKLKYFIGALSSAEAVVKIDSSADITAAALYKTHISQFDVQFLGGILAEEDIAAGLGWAGGFGQIGFRGEMSYLHPVKDAGDTTGLFFISVALDYTFPNSLMLQAEGLYNQLPRGSSESFIDFYSRPLSVKDLSFTEYNLFAQASYPFTPLLNGSLAAIFFPRIHGYFLGPSMTCSLGNNLDIALFLQYFKGNFPGLSGIEKQSFTMAFVRAKWNF